MIVREDEEKREEQRRSRNKNTREKKRKKRFTLPVNNIAQIHDIINYDSSGDPRYPLRDLLFLLPTFNNHDSHLIRTLLKSQWKKLHKPAPLET